MRAPKRDLSGALRRGLGFLGLLAAAPAPTPPGPAGQQQRAKRRAVECARQEAEGGAPAAKAEGGGARPARRPALRAHRQRPHDGELQEYLRTRSTDSVRDAVRQVDSGLDKSRRRMLVARLHPPVAEEAGGGAPAAEGGA